MQEHDEEILKILRRLGVENTYKSVNKTEKEICKEHIEELLYHIIDMENIIN